MTENSKPTPGPWLRVHRHPDKTHSASIAYIEGEGRRSPLEICTVFCCDRDAENSANADLIAEAGTVYHETGLTPRQLAEQNDKFRATCVELLWGLDTIIAAIEIEFESIMTHEQATLLRDFRASVAPVIANRKEPT